MECPKCGYMMEAFEQECPKCKRLESRRVASTEKAPQEPTQARTTDTGKTAKSVQAGVQNRVPVGTAMRRLRIERGESQADVAALLNITRQAYSKYESGKAEPSLDSLLLLSNHWQVSLNEVSGCDAPSPNERWAVREEIYPHDAYEPRVDLPVWGEVRAGHNGIAFHKLSGRLRVEARLVEHDIRNYFWLRAKDNSMIMEGIRDGSLVLIHRQDTVEDGDLALVALVEEEATIKRIRHAGKMYILIPANPAYSETIISMENAHIIGRVEYATINLKR